MLRISRLLPDNFLRFYAIHTENINFSIVNRSQILVTGYNFINFTKLDINILFDM